MMIEEPVAAKPKELSLLPLGSCAGYSHYAFSGNEVAKTSASPAVLVFQ